MRYSILVSDAAEEDMLAAYKWYEEQNSGLGDYFLSTVKTSLDDIKDNPLFYGYRRKNVRGCIVKKFPFLILFKVVRNEIRVISVFHMSRKSK